MADFSWREKLNLNPMFESLQESYSQLPDGKESLNLLASKDDSIFVWDELNKYVLTTAFSASKTAADTHLRKHQVSWHVC